MKISHRSTSSLYPYMEVCRLGMDLAPEGDMLAANDITRMLIVDGKAPRYVEREPGTPGPWKIDDSEALAVIRAKRRDHPDWPMSRVIFTANKNLNGTPADLKRWRRKADEEHESFS